MRSQSRVGQEQIATVDAVRAVQSVDGAPPFGRGAGMSSTAEREIRREGGESAAKHGENKCRSRCGLQYASSGRRAAHIKSFCAELP